MCVRNPVFVGVMAGLILGGTISWYLNKPTPRWMEFEWLTAHYRPEGLVIALNGEYRVIRKCPLSRGGVIWRTEAIATDGQIALYGPTESHPDLTTGNHVYKGNISLLEPINPDGWIVRVIVTCPAENPETVVSPPAPVDLIELSWP